MKTRVKEAWSTSMYFDGLKLQGSLASRKLLCKFSNLFNTSKIFEPQRKVDQLPVSSIKINISGLIHFKFYLTISFCQENLWIRSHPTSKSIFIVPTLFLLHFGSPFAFIKSFSFVLWSFLPQWIKNHQFEIYGLRSRPWSIQQASTCQILMTNSVVAGNKTEKPQNVLFLFTDQILSLKNATKLFTFSSPLRVCLHWPNKQAGELLPWK